MAAIKNTPNPAPLDASPQAAVAPAGGHEGHGRSIAAFAAQHGGPLRCSTDSGSFTLRLLL